MVIDFKKVWETIKDKKNVVGFSTSLKERMANGVNVKDTKVIRVYVSKKESLDQLDPVDVIPKIIEGAETDVVEIGEIEAHRNNEDTGIKTVR